jgi:hypothetical protein
MDTLTIPKKTMAFFAFSDKKDYRDRGIEMIKEVVLDDSTANNTLCFYF